MSCLVGYIINVDCGVDVGHVGHLFGVLCAHCTCLPVSVNTLHRNESVVGRGSSNSSGGNSSVFLLCVDMCVDMCVDVDVAVYTAVSLSKPDTASQLGYSVRTFSDHTKVCTCSVVCVVIGSDV